MSVIEVIQSKFNMKEDVKSPYDKDLEFDNLLKYVNFVSAKKGEIRGYSGLKINDMSLSALKATASYSAEEPIHKLNITK